MPSLDICLPLGLVPRSGIYRSRSCSEVPTLHYTQQDFCSHEYIACFIRSALTFLVRSKLNMSVNLVSYSLCNFDT